MINFYDKDTAPDGFVYRQEGWWLHVFRVNIQKETDVVELEDAESWQRQTIDKVELKEMIDILMQIHDKMTY